MILTMLAVAAVVLFAELCVNLFISAYQCRKEFKYRVIGTKLEDFKGRFWLYMVDEKKQLIPTNSDQAPGLIVKNGIITGLF